MSQPRDPHVIVWKDQDGTTHREETKRPSRGVSLAALPDRLVNGYCPEGHLTACLLPSSDETRPVVMAHRPGLHPGVMFVLVGATLVAALETEGNLHGVGRPRDAFSVWCPTCSKDYELRGDALRLAADAYTGKTRRVGLLTSGGPLR